MLYCRIALFANEFFNGGTSFGAVPLRAPVPSPLAWDISVISLAQGKRAHLYWPI